MDLLGVSGKCVRNNIFVENMVFSIDSLQSGRKPAIWFQARCLCVYVSVSEVDLVFGPVEVVTLVTT